MAAGVGALGTMGETAPLRDKLSVLLKKPMEMVWTGK